MKTGISVFVIISLSLYLNAQVKGPERIIGTYTGELKKGIAHGQGKSIGIDTYEGSFGKGYPKGEGMYIFGEEVEIDGDTCKNGDMYKGSFLKGRFEGYGRYTYIDKQKPVLEGYWSKGKYVGKTKDGYVLIEKSNIDRLVCRNNGTSRNQVVIKGIDDIVEVGKINLEFNNQDTYNDLPSSKFPFTIHVKGTVPATGEKAELKIMIERPGIWSIEIFSN